MSVKITPQEALQQMNETLSKKETSAADQCFQDAAAVLIHFNPATLNAYTPGLKPATAGWRRFFSYCTPVKKKDEKNLWQLRDQVRRDALKRLGTRENMQAALNVNPIRSEDPVQIIFESVIKNNTIDMASLRRHELVSLSGIVEWLNDILPITDLKRQIDRAIPMADLLSPMHRLVSNDFVGRKKELDALAEYVGILPDNGILSSAGRFVTKLFTDPDKNPPLLIYGPGGLGKSTLIGKFILDNVEKTKVPLPFAYLDTDKAIIDPKQPKTYLLEAARQLETQIPEQKEALQSLKDDIQYSMKGFDSIEVSKSFYEGDKFAVQFGYILSRAKSPVLFVVDTFEEAQYLGADVVNGVWLLLGSLQREAPNLRIIVLGRANVDSVNVKAIELTELSREEARQLISNGLKKDFQNSTELKKATDDIIDVAGLNPLSLRLSLLIVHEQGVEKLKQVETKNWFLRRVRTELVQARLYGRILMHIKDDNIKKLAKPGLIVRRITKGVISEILAEPCKLKFETPQKIDELMEVLMNEALLIDRDPDDGALCHRQDVRRVMLNDLKNEVKADVVKKIHDNAVQYYSKNDSIIARAEEIYHRLSRGDEPKDVEKRWMPGIENRLRNALEELPAKSIVWLSGKLGVTPDKDLLKDADLEAWEGVTATSVQRYLQTGQPALALDVLRSRADRTTFSPLYRLELETLRYLGLYEEGAYVADEMLAAIPNSADPALVCEIYIQGALIKEALNLYDEAIAYINKASALKENEYNRETLRILVTQIRLLRKKGDEQNQERSALIEKTLQYIADPGMVESLRDNPALLREMVAELGKLQPLLLENAIDWVGIEILNDEQAEALSGALHDWNLDLKEASKSKLGELAERASLEDNKQNDWTSYVKKNNGRRLNSNIYHWRKELFVNAKKTKVGETVTKFDKALVDIYRNNVELSIKRNSIELK